VDFLARCELTAYRVNIDAGAIDNRGESSPPSS
jgi:hypothetical protein